MLAIAINMKAVEEYGPEIQTLNKFVSQLDPAVRAEAFKFLLAREFSDGETIDEFGGSAVAAINPKQAKASDDRSLSPQELLRKVGAGSSFDKAVVFGYWLEMHQGQKSFSGGNLKEVFEAARETPPANPSDVVAKLERSGRFMRAEKIGGTQYYRLTRTALEEIGSRLT
jgi:hypothetical protein